jgi:hypothetical protein
LQRSRSKKLGNKNKRKTAKIKGILVREGIVVRDKKEASRRITKFWSNLYSLVREFDLDLLDQMIEEHDARFLEVD